MMCKDECDLIWSGSFQNALMKESFGVLIYASKAACVDVYTYVVGPSIPHHIAALTRHTSTTHTAHHRFARPPAVIFITHRHRHHHRRANVRSPKWAKPALAWGPGTGYPGVVDGWMDGCPGARPSVRPSVPLSPQKMSRPPIPVAHPPLPHSNWGCRRRRCFGGNSRVGG